MPQPAESCAAIRERLSDYLEGFLEGGDTTRVQGHLGACPACREALNGLEGGIAALKRAPRPLPGTAFREAARARAGFGTAPSPSAFRWAALAAGLLVALTAVFRMTRTDLPTALPPLPAPAPLARAGIPATCEGRAEYRAAGASAWIPMGPRARLAPGDLLRTGSEGASLLLEGQPVPLPARTLVQVEEAGDRSLRLTYFHRRAELEQDGTLQSLRLLDPGTSVSLVRRDGSMGLMTDDPSGDGWSRLQEAGFTRPVLLAPATEPEPAPKPSASKEF